MPRRRSTTQSSSERSPIRRRCFSERRSELRRATWDERTIRFDYSDVEGRQTTRSVDPLSIVYMQASHCLLAWCHLRKDFRAFRLDRMRNLTVTDASFRPRRVPMLRDCLAQMCG